MGTLISSTFDTNTMLVITEIQINMNMIDILRRYLNNPAINGMFSTQSLYKSIAYKCLKDMIPTT